VCLIDLAAFLSSRVAERDDGRVTRRISGLAALVGATFLAIKSLGILVTGEQVPFLFEAAPACLGLCVLTLSDARGTTGQRPTVTTAVGGMSLAVAVASFVADLAGEEWGPGLGLAMIGVSVGALVAGWRPQGWTDRALLAAAVVPYPALLLGGALERVNERLLEVALLPVAAAWAWVGIRLLRGRVG